MKVEAASEECNVNKLSFEKHSITVLYQINSGSYKKELPKVTTTPADCSDDFEIIIKSIESQNLSSGQI